MEHYADRLKREINEMQEAHPGLEQLIHELKSIENRPQSDFDYAIEREALRYQAVTKFLKLLKHGVMQAEGSDVSEGAAVGKERGQKPVRVGTKMFKCKCGYETDSSLMWSCHADICSA